MKIKIGDKTYSGDNELIMVILNEKDKKNISGMNSKSFKYCSYPTGTPSDKVAEFMGAVKKDLRETGKS